MHMQFGMHTYHIPGILRPLIFSTAKTHTHTSNIRSPTSPKTDNRRRLMITIHHFIVIINLILIFINIREYSVYGVYTSLILSS